MAYSKPTLATLKQSLADRKESGDLPTDSATLALWIRTFNRAVEYCLTRVGITQSTSLTTASGTIALPDDFVTVVKVLDASDNEYAQIGLEDSDSASTGDQVYWISGDFASGFYLNSPDDEALTVYYTYRPSPMTTDTDECPFPDEEAVVSYAYGMLRKAESDPFEDANASLAETESRLQEIKAQFNVNEGLPELKLPNNA